jgi:hypothetical protein
MTAITASIVCPFYGSIGHGCQTYDLPFNKSELGNESNVDSNGVYVYRIDFINGTNIILV